MKTIKKLKHYYLRAFILFSALAITSCSDDDDVAAPEEENDVEVITDLTLIFTNTADLSDQVRATAQDPDGIGAQELQVLGAINLAPDTEYELTFEILNALDADDVEDIGDEVLEEDNEHQFFYSFSNNAFESPMGDGNIDNASDPLNYNDMDENGNPVGLSTLWTTPLEASAERTFTVRLQHQPDLKSATTGAADGDTDIDVMFTLNIQ